MQRGEALYYRDHQRMPLRFFNYDIAGAATGRAIVIDLGYEADRTDSHEMALLFAECGMQVTSRISENTHALDPKAYLSVGYLQVAVHAIVTSPLFSPSWAPTFDIVKMIDILVYRSSEYYDEVRCGCIWI